MEKLNIMASMLPDRKVEVPTSTGGLGATAKLTRDTMTAHHDPREDEVAIIIKRSTNPLLATSETTSIIAPMCVDASRVVDSPAMR